MAKVHRAFVYRIYPSPEQEQRLLRWEGTLRFLWNLAHEQRLLGLARSKSERVYPSWYDQKKELTDLREEHEWLADMSRDAQDQMLQSLDRAWDRCFKRKGGKPGFKSKSKHVMGIASSNPESFGIEGDRFKFPKLGEMRIVQHRPLEGAQRRATIRRDVDQWFVSIMCQAEVKDHVQKDTMSVVGIDRGVTNAIADSSGILVPRPDFLDDGQRKIARLQKQLSRKERGSKRKEKLKNRIARAHRKLRRQREHFLNVESYRYVKNHDVVVVEDLDIANMTKSAKGTVEEPGKNVKQKSGLNRSILSIGWGQFVQLLEQKAARFGTKVVKVRAAYSSQTCAKCGHVDEANRKGPTFDCTKCGHKDHADVNAAKVLVQRYNDSLRSEGEGALRGKSKRKPKKRVDKDTPSTARVQAIP
jgi:putative transposase